jgi:hypothetical protein
VVLRYQWLKDFRAARLEDGQGACLIGLHHSAVADYVSSKNSSETTLHNPSRSSPASIG